MNKNTPHPKDDNSQNKTVALYCRVSTYEQSKGEFSSLDNQELILREYCQSRNWNIFAKRVREKPL